MRRMSILTAHKSTGLRDVHQILNLGSAVGSFGCHIAVITTLNFEVIVGFSRDFLHIGYQVFPPSRTEVPKQV